MPTREARVIIARVATGPIYVETDIACPFDALWSHTQDPSRHERWDLRFSQIEYLPREQNDDTQRFVYERRLLPGVVVRGWGETRGERRRPDGRSRSGPTSAGH